MRDSATYGLPKTFIVFWLSVSVSEHSGQTNWRPRASTFDDVVDALDFYMMLRVKMRDKVSHQQRFVQNLTCTFERPE